MELSCSQHSYFGTHPFEEKGKPSVQSISQLQVTQSAQLHIIALMMLFIGGCLMISPQSARIINIIIIVATIALRRKRSDIVSLEMSLF